MLFKGNRQVRALFRRNLLQNARYFFAFALLMGIFFVSCYIYIRNFTREEAIGTYQQRLDNGVEAVDSVLTALANAGDMIEQNSVYRPILNRGITLPSIDLDGMRKLMNAYLLPYDLIAEFGLTQGNEMLYTNRRVYYQAPLLKADRYFMPANGMESFLGQFTGNPSILASASYRSVDTGRYDAVAVAYRWSQAKQLYLFATMRTQALFKAVAEGDVLAEGTASISYKGQPIASVGSAPAVGSVTLQATAKSTPLQFTIVIPNAYIERHLANLGRLALLFFALVGVTAIVWTLIFSYLAARPFRRVTTSLLHTQGFSEGLPVLVSVNDLLSGISAYGGRVKGYQETMEAQREALRQHLFDKALYHGLFGEDQAQAFLREFPDFPKKARMALFRSKEQGAGVSDPGAHVASITAQLSHFAQRAMIHPLEPGSFLAVLAEEEGADTAGIVGDFCKNIRELNGMTLAYWLSGVFTHPSEMADVFARLEDESGLALQSHFPISFRQIQSMHDALTAGDAAAAINTLRACSLRLKEPEQAVLAKYVYRMVATMLMMVKLESQSDLSGIPVPAYTPADHTMLFEHDLPDCFMKIAEHMADIRKNERKNEKESLEENLIAYLDSHISNPALSVGMLSDVFHVSAPTLQKRLQAAVGQSVAEYVENARMEKARKALRDTDRPVQDIALECGYINVNSFYKAYKRRYGEAPLASRR